MSGSELFWSSGTWLLFFAQIAVIGVAVIIYVFQGKKQAAADRDSTDNTAGEQP